MAASSTAASPESGSPAARTGVPGREEPFRAVCTVHAGPAGPVSAWGAAGGASRVVRIRSSMASVAWQWSATSACAAASCRSR